MKCRSNQRCNLQTLQSILLLRSTFLVSMAYTPQTQTHQQRYLVDTEQVTENQLDKHTRADTTQHSCNQQGTDQYRPCSGLNHTSILLCQLSHCMHSVDPL